MATPLSFRRKLPSIYPITDKTLAGKASHLAIVRELVRGGARLVQVRDKQTPVRELLLDLQRCAEYCDRHDVVMIVDDRCDLALSAGASGVHLGQEDLPPEAARKILGDSAIIGYSTHSLRQIRRASSSPIQYAGFGPIYLTSTKLRPSPVVGVSGLRKACRASRVPVAAIGGIGAAQVLEVLDAGAASAAVISAVMACGDIAKSMERLLRIARARE